MDDRGSAKQQESEEGEVESMEKLDQAMREIEELLPRVKGEELRRTLQEKYYQLLKKS
jgi:hypothetical protein